MEKGDIVRLEKKSFSILSYAAYDLPSWRYIDKFEDNEANIPTEFVIESSTPGQFCGGRHAALTFEGIPGVFNARYFRVVLKAGEPDVAKLLEESKETQHMLVGL